MLQEHYCTYFDRGFLTQGLALFHSLREHDPQSHLWVLCLDEFTASVLRDLRNPNLSVVPLAELETADPELAAVKDSRTKVEYYFTLSPCWPRFLLRTRAEIDRITYLDADMLWFGPAQAVFQAMGRKSILVTEHRHPEFLAHHARFGRFNVGILSFRRDEAGTACLELWRKQCLEWCFDRYEHDRYADQKYLDSWPERFGEAVCILNHVGVNLAPWNWYQHRYSFRGSDVLVDGAPLILFHFARFRAVRGTWWFQSGQLEYGVMPWTLRQKVYGRYWKALEHARETLKAIRPDYAPAQRSARGWHQYWRAALPRALFGSDWLRVGPFFVSGRFSLGRFSGRALSALRNFARALRQRGPRSSPQPATAPVGNSPS